MNAAAVRLRGIAKRFGSVQALRGADLSVSAGEVHALLGENGAGKSTLMHVLGGLEAPDAGAIEVAGREVRIPSPRDAMALGIALVRQHFTFVPRMSVAENVWLGRSGRRFDRRQAANEVRRVGDATGLVLDPAALAGALPVGLQQRLEIVKVLARDVRVLVLDEPTAALTPGEVAHLFAALRRLAAAGVAIVLITHKMREVAAIADRVTVLRGGEVVLSGRADGLAPAALGRAMIGAQADAQVMAAALEEAREPEPRATKAAVLQVRNLSVGSAVRDISFDVAQGEVVGIAAVEGNGQRELLRAVAGILPHGGEATLRGGGRVGFVPEDRQGEGLILDFTLAENLALGSMRGLLLRRRRLESAAAEAMAQFDIRAGGPAQSVRTLSGGNQQKVVLARVLAQRPALVVAENPTRGLDLHATAYVHERLRGSAREDGLGVLFHSSDLDEVLALSDRVAIMVAGAWRWVELADRTRERVGAAMLGEVA